MKRHFKKSTATAAMIISFLGGAAFAGEEKVIELSEVPADIMEVAKANLVGLKLAVDEPGPLDDDSEIDDNIVLYYEDLGDVKLVSANTETEVDGSFVYEIQGTVEGGRRIEIDIEPDGDVEEIEIQFNVDDVPGAVMNALTAKLSGFVPEFIEASHAPSMQVIGYEFVGMSGGNKMDIEVSPDGRNITVADQ